MADDDKGDKPGTPATAEHAAISRGEPGTDRAPQTEWTASDRRGPLDSAGDEGVERIEPAHELDAEGRLDPARDTSAVVAEHEPHEPAEHEAGLEPAVRADEIRHNDVQGAPSSPASGLAGDEPRGAEPVPERKRSLVPVAAGVVVGALIGAGSAWLVYSQAGAGNAAAPQVAALSSRVDALDQRPDPRAALGKLQSEVDGLQGKVAALQSRPDGTKPATGTKPADGMVTGQGVSAPTTASRGDGKAPSDKPAATSASNAAAPSDASLAGKVAALQAALDEVKARTAALQSQDAKESGDAAKVASLQTSVADARKQAAGAQSALDSVKSEQKQLGDKLAGLTVAVAGALKTADGAQKQAAGAQSGVDTVQSRQKVLEGKLGSPALAVVADSLVQQIVAGQPFTRQVDALAALDADPAKVAVLRENAAHGVPSAQALLGQWAPLADPVIATGNTAPANANFGQRLEHGLMGLVSVRRADGTTGSDLGSRVALIESDLAHGDVPGAFTTWQAMPSAAKARSQNWGALAKTSVEALAAGRQLQQSAIDALGAKKS